MIRITLLMIIGVLVAGGWAYAREQEMLNHASDAVQVMDGPGCDPSSNPSGGQ